MKTALLFLATLATISAAAPTVSSSVFQVRLVLRGPSPAAETASFVQPGKEPGHVIRETLHLRRTPLLDHTAVQSAALITDGSGGAPRIEVTFTTAGRKRFAEITRQNIGERLAVLMGGRVWSAPKIAMEIPGGKMEIRGSFSAAEAQEMVARIQAATRQR